MESTEKSKSLYYRTILTLTFVILFIFFMFNYIVTVNISLTPSMHSFISKMSKYRLLNMTEFIQISSSTTRTTTTRKPFVWKLDKILTNITFTKERAYHHDGIVYDYYSQNDFNRTEAPFNWKSWSLPFELNETSWLTRDDISPDVMTKLPFVNAIYVMTDRRLTQRHTNLIKALRNQGINNETLQWRLEWNFTTCNANETHDYVFKRLNLKDKPLAEDQKRKCSLAMKHADVWYEMAEKNVSLALILEDDAIFVPFFKEKFTRMIYAGIQSGILRLNSSCVKPTDKRISNEERMNQNPMIVIGVCFNFRGRDFQSDLMNPPPVFSTQKSNPSRCTHAYVLTACSAEALVYQIKVQKNDFWPSDFMQNLYFPVSPTLQSFWMDPPLAYQGNHATDLDNIPSFKVQTYMTDN